MELDHDACYEAFFARDQRFDGRLFVGVKTTGIYCRPVCPARVPKRANVHFYTSAAAAAQAGFRPCLRCRPETSPGIGAWCGTSNTVTRALAMIDSGALDEQSVGQLADRLGVGERHLRRLFLQHVGAAPVTVAQTRRVLLAKQLIHETVLPMTEIAIAAGFGSLRRFNEAFQSMYGRPPSELRRAKSNAQAVPPKGELTVLLRYRPPYDWDSMLDMLARQAISGVETVEEGRYARSILIDGEPGTVSVRRGAANAIEVTMRTARMSALAPIIVRMRRLFDLSADPDAINAHLSHDARLAGSIAVQPGLRVAGSWDNTETAVRALLEYRLGPARVQHLMAGIATAYGAAIDGAAHGLPAITRVFPQAGALVQADLGALALPPKVAEALHALATAIAGDDGLFGAGAGVEGSCNALCRDGRLDRAMAEHIAQRVLMPSDAWPMTVPALASDVQSRWHPWRAYAAQHLPQALGSDSMDPTTTARNESATSPNTSRMP